MKSIEDDAGNPRRDSAVTRRDFLGGAAALGAGTLLAYTTDTALAAMGPLATDAIAKTQVLTIPDPAKLRILQVTDIHLEYDRQGMLDDRQRRWKLDAIAAMVDRFKPDILVNTGDFWISKSSRGQFDTCRLACQEFAKFKTPWAFAWGNHDEAVDYPTAHATIEKTPFALYSGAADGNYRIEVRSPDGQPVWNLLMLNNSRGGFRQEQLDWLRRESANIRKATPAPPTAFAFFHIPLPQYDDLAKSGKALGVCFESVCHENGSREAFAAFRDSGCVKATFCGHDHVNDCHGLLDGLWLEYGRALGGYGENVVHKGAKLIEVDATRQTFASRTVFADGQSYTFDRFLMA